VKDRADKLHFLLHAFREFFDFLVHPGSQFEALAPSMSTFRSFCARQSLELREKHEVRQHFHFLVKAALLWKIAEAVGVGAAQRFSENEHAPGIGTVMPIIMRRVLVFPAPFGPSNP